jgi:hypothetical protein
VSRFVGDMPSSAIHHTITPALASLQHARKAAAERPHPFNQRPAGPWSHPQAQAAASMRRAPEPAREVGERYVEREDHETASGAGEGGLRRGARVEHKTFGVGVVVGVEGTVDPTVTVKFSGYAPKSIKARFLRLAER